MNPYTPELYDHKTWGMSPVSGGDFTFVSRRLPSDPCYASIFSHIPPLAVPAAVVIHTESVKHYGNQDVPNVVVEAMVDRGERSVRRSLRVWPEGKSLSHRRVDGSGTVSIEWFWVENDVVVTDERRLLVSALLQQLRAGAEQRDHRTTAKVIHDFVVSHPHDAPLVDAVLLTLDPTTVSVRELVSLLIETKAIAGQLKGRPAIRQSAHDRLVRDVGYAEAELTLRFL